MFPQMLTSFLPQVLSEVCPLLAAGRSGTRRSGDLQPMIGAAIASESNEGPTRSRATGPSTNPYSQSDESPTKSHVTDPYSEGLGARSSQANQALRDHFG
jgi:hypothetical protein